VKSLVLIAALARGGCDQSASTPPAGSGSGAVAVATTGSAATKLGQTTLSPEARGELDKLTGAPPNAPVKASPPGKAAAKPSVKPTLAPRPAKAKNVLPEYGPQRGEELTRIPDFESNHDRWDYGTTRKRALQNYYGSIYVAYRCDERDGCEGAGATGWTPVGWYLR
jgi:hypothetical protein